MNPRDLFFFAPFFSILSAIGILIIIDFSKKQHKDALIIYLLSCFGFLSLAQSMLISNYGPLAIKNMLDGIAGLFGGSLAILSGQTSINQMALLSSILNMLIFTSIISVIIFIPFIVNLVMSFVKSKLKIQVILKRQFRLKSFNSMSINVIVVSVLLFIIMVAPYIWLTYETGDGNFQNFSKAQLDSQWGGLYTQVAAYMNSNTNDEEVILVDYYAFRPLQYFIQKNVSVISLDIAGNLAALEVLSNQIHRHL